MYYDKNLDIGKVTNDTTNEEADREPIDNNINKDAELIMKPDSSSKVNKKPNQKRKQNVVLDSFYKSKHMGVNNLKKDTIEEFGIRNMDREMYMENDRLVAERNFRNKRKVLKKRGLFRFKADV